MSAQHTLGPWEVFSVYAQHEVRTPTGSLIAAVNSRNDARLISAAPDLRAALAQLLCQCERVGMTTRDDEPFLDAARAAIAKATGSTP